MQLKSKKSKKLFYKPTYNLGLIEHKILKTYIKTNLANGFIRSWKSLAKTLVIFVQKLDGSFYLCVNYLDFNNFTIKD